VNLGFITYFIDIEQLTIANVHHFQYPLWPPKAIVNLIHTYGQKYDPLLLARPAFWKMTIWIDVLWNGPFYVAALYAIARGRDWIRVPALVWSGSRSAVVLIILAEEHSGIYRTPHFGFVLLLNLPWLALPLATIARMRREHPFTEPAPPAIAGDISAAGAAAAIGGTGAGTGGTGGAAAIGGVGGAVPAGEAGSDPAWT
jgi:EXPERA (EXPanded EBP superfamily)